MGTWIEMSVGIDSTMHTRSFPAMGTWIEMASKGGGLCADMSFPAMGTWIEILHCEWRS